MMKPIVMSAALLIAAPVIANAQPLYPAYPYNQVQQPYPYYPVPVRPPSWSYNPYTSGLGACPQWLPGDSPCRETMPPSYGQPNFRALTR